MYKGIISEISTLKIKPNVILGEQEHCFADRNTVIHIGAEMNDPCKFLFAKNSTNAPNRANTL